MEEEAKGSITARKVQKADREKLRRDRLNEQFLELGKALNPDRPKNDKASILTDTIQMLKELTSQVEKLKSEYAALSEESRELTHEKNDLREEKGSLKSDIENLNAQYAHRVRSMYPWSGNGMDQSLLMHPSSYQYSIPIPIPTGPIPLQPYPFYGNQNPPVVPSPCPAFVPYMARDPVAEQLSMQHKQDQRQRDKCLDGESRIEKNDDSNDVTTDLELKTPGSTSEQDSSTKRRRSRKAARKETDLVDASSSGGCSSSRSLNSISSSCIADGKETV